MADPLFISGSIHKSDKDYSLNVIRFQEHIVRMHRIKFWTKRRPSSNTTEMLWAAERWFSEIIFARENLENLDNLFKNSSLAELIHYAIGIPWSQATNSEMDQSRLFDSPKRPIQAGRRKAYCPYSRCLTTNLLPYNYDPKASCQRFIQFLNEIFLNDRRKSALSRRRSGMPSISPFRLQPFSFYLGKEATASPFSSIP